MHTGHPGGHCSEVLWCFLTALDPFSSCDPHPQKLCLSLKLCCLGLLQPSMSDSKLSMYAESLPTTRLVSMIHSKVPSDFGFRQEKG